MSVHVDRQTYKQTDGQTNGQADINELKLDARSHLPTLSRCYN